MLKSYPQINYKNHLHHTYTYTILKLSRGNQLDIKYMSDLTNEERYNHQMAVYGETEFDTPKIKRRECDTCHRTLFIREHKDTCMSCRKEIREQQILNDIANSKCPIYPNITSYSEMNNYLGL